MGIMRFYYADADGVPHEYWPEREENERVKDKQLQDAAAELDDMLLSLTGPKLEMLGVSNRRLAIIRRKLKLYANAASKQAVVKLKLHREVLLEYGDDSPVQQAPEILRQLGALVQDDDRASAHCRHALRWAIYWLQSYHREQAHLTAPKGNYRP